MRRASRFYRALVWIVAVWALVGCGAASGEPVEPADGGSGGKEGGTLTVFAASSLTDAFGELAEVFEERNPGVEVRATFAASSVIVTQILQGAPADVFATADQAKMRAAVERGVVAGEPEVFARNKELVVVPEGNPARIEDLRDLAKPGVKLVLAQDGVPAAEYAGEILDKAEVRYREDFEEKVLSNLVSREPDVRVAVNRVALGDADATFGYASDVTPDMEGRVEIVEIPEGLNVVAAYPIAALEGSESSGLARRWIGLVLSDEGQRVLREWGFQPA
ncbi:MAG: molybdate ABC transporter substrate-binding protein [Actinomycetota bacterium]|nr:molybdate ABC transporter substrate-binding protein [Actinomycetota bacterium]